MSSFRCQIAGIIGNILENYDKALFGLLAPCIAPLFFHDNDPLTALILTYAILPIGALMRPIGSLFFGYIGDRYGRRDALSISLLGMAIVTTAMGFLPTAKEVGCSAPLLLAITRMLQNFFAAGESPGAAIFILEHTEEKKRCIADGFYGSSSMIGILLASFLVTMFSNDWRMLFLLGGITGFVGLIVRRIVPSQHKFIPTKMTVLKVLIKERFALASIILASGFSYVTYSLSFTLMNGFIPLVTNLTSTQVLQANTLLLVVDMSLLPLFGYFASKFGKEKLMALATLFAFISAIPLFLLLHEATLVTVVLVRFAIILSGVAFAAPYHAWAIAQVPAEHRYTLLSFGGALGALLLGTPACACSLWLYKTLQWPAAPALYLLFVSVLAFMAVLYTFFRLKRLNLIAGGT